jgi:cell wall-associated NlpC family hydrolase
MGVPYRWGGVTRQGMDCSALVRAIIRETYGIELPRTSAEMFTLGQPVPERRQLRPGDLVFFHDTYSGPGVSHVGVYVGDGRFAHASVTQGGTIGSLGAAYFRQRYAGARRIRG